jgi:hypothetical protein
MLYRAKNPYTEPFLHDAFDEGVGMAAGVSADNIPYVGDRINKCVDYVGLGPNVTRKNRKEYHLLLTLAAVDNATQYSPFEFTAKWFNSFEEGGFGLFDEEGELLGVYDTREAALEKASEGDQVIGVPSSDEMWEAFREGVEAQAYEEIRNFDYGDDDEDYFAPEDTDWEEDEEENEDKKEEEDDE